MLDPKTIEKLQLSLAAAQAISKQPFACVPVSIPNLQDLLALATAFQSGEKVFRCNHCEGIYLGGPPAECDCTSGQQSFRECRLIDPNHAQGISLSSKPNPKPEKQAKAPTQACSSLTKAFSVLLQEHSPQE